MNEWPTNDWRTYLSHSLELRHSWGKKPEQKAREKEYNHEYYEKNKERILAARKKHGDTGYSGKYFKDDDDSNGGGSASIDTEDKSLEELMKLNDEMGGYDEEAMKNIRQHNQNILDNISALTKNVNDYIAAHPEMSAEQRKQVMDNYQSQVDKAMDLALDLRKDSTKEYLRSIGIVPNGSSGKKSSETSSSGSGSSGSSSKSEEKSSSSNKSSSSKEDDRPWWEKADDKYNKKKKPKGLADTAGSKTLHTQAYAYEQERLGEANKNTGKRTGPTQRAKNTTSGGSGVHKREATNTRKKVR